MEILSREQDASYIEAKGLKSQVWSIVLPIHWMLYSTYPHYYGRYQRVIGTEKDKNKVSDECVRRGIHKLRKNETLWAPLIASPIAHGQISANDERSRGWFGMFVDSLKVLDPSLA